jgi:hypothetical protein
MSAHLKCVALDRTLKGTNWAGGAACIVLVGEVDQVIARLFNKAEKAMTSSAGAESTEKPQDAPAELPAENDPAAAEIAPPGEEESK